MQDKDQIKERVKELTGWVRVGDTRLVSDTTEWMNIHRGDIICLKDRKFIVKGNARETRFGIKDQPKYWVFNTIDMDSGENKIVKTVFYEDFHVHIAVFKMRCYRSPKKEARVLDLVRGDSRFMQGTTLIDEKQNTVRVVDFIRGKTILEHIMEIDKPHEQYFQEDLPKILWNLKDSIEAILFLHENKTCHGDIRNDHIIVESGTGRYRWIDFDLTQDASDFDIWSIGNILGYAVGQGIRSFHGVLRKASIPAEVKESLCPDDASAFYEYRIMNLSKLFPYIPPKLSELLRHFTIRPQAFYSHISQFVNEYYDMLDSEFPAG
ncbi:MAG: hypothetical protein ACYTG7_09695 [Planctomycetota bacterium]|jgi:tRNA A-37 threonylcarbamoyl transferase component Bud32